MAVLLTRIAAGAADQKHPHREPLWPQGCEIIAALATAVMVRAVATPVHGRSSVPQHVIRSFCWSIFRSTVHRCNTSLAMAIALYIVSRSSIHGIARLHGCDQILFFSEVHLPLPSSPRALPRPGSSCPSSRRCAFSLQLGHGRTNFLALHHSTRTQQLVGARTMLRVTSPMRTKTLSAGGGQHLPTPPSGLSCRG